uniref:Uncharacterized protein LOC108050646 n=1 Tax=Drosophila rhopaloa TaxID=1041015 RepID=A0A6P4FFA7_DRORH
MISAMDNFDNRSYGAISKGRSEFSMPELTPEQQKLLIELRRRKQELLLEIQVSDQRTVMRENTDNHLAIKKFKLCIHQFTKLYCNHSQQSQ